MRPRRRPTVRRGFNGAVDNCRRRRSRARASSSRAHRFNGAVDNCRRRRRGPGRSPRRCRCFNGAVDNCRRRLGLGAQAAADLVASMGPSTTADGDEKVYQMPRHIPGLLQWGRRQLPTETTSGVSRGATGPLCFNGAVDNCRRRQMVPSGSLVNWPLLQWGRRQLPTETACE